MTLKTRTAVVTGSTSGIGLAIARAMAAEGANVVINGLGHEGEIEAGAPGHRGGFRRQGPLFAGQHAQSR